MHKSFYGRKLNFTYFWSSRIKKKKSNFSLYENLRKPFQVSIINEDFEMESLVSGIRLKENKLQ